MFANKNMEKYNLKMRRRMIFQIIRLGATEDVRQSKSAV